MNIVRFSEDNSQLLIEKYFRPLHPHLYSRGIKGPKSEMCDHRSKDHKHGKIPYSKSQQMKHHHQDPSHHHHPNQQNVHHPDDSESHE